MVRSFKDSEQVSGIFNTQMDVQELLSEVKPLQIGREDVSILMSDRTRDKYFSEKEETKAPEGVTVGGISGGLLGALIGGLTMVGSVFIPGVNLLVAGPLIGILTGGAIGATAGGLVGALVGAGIPEHEAKFYERALKDEGNILVVAHVKKENVGEVRKIFQHCGAQQVKVTR